MPNQNQTIISYPLTVFIPIVENHVSIQGANQQQGTGFVLMADIAEPDPTENGIAEMQPENFAPVNPEGELTRDYLDIKILGITMRERFSGGSIEELMGWPQAEVQKNKQIMMWTMLHICVSMYHVHGPFPRVRDRLRIERSFKLYHQQASDRLRRSFQEALYSYCVSQYAGVPKAESYKLIITMAVNLRCSFRLEPKEGQVKLPYPWQSEAITVEQGNEQGPPEVQETGQSEDETSGADNTNTEQSAPSEDYEESRDYLGITLMGKSLDEIINEENTRDILERNPDLLDRQVIAWHLVCVCVCHYHTRGPYLEPRGIIVLHRYFDKVAEGLSDILREAYTIGLFYHCIARFGHIPRLDAYADVIMDLRFNQGPLRFEPQEEYSEIPYPCTEL